MATATKILHFLNETRPEPVRAMDEELHLDSLQFIRLNAFLQDELNVPITDEELTLENFRTLQSIALLVTSKNPAFLQGSRAGPSC